MKKLMKLTLISLVSITFVNCAQMAKKQEEIKSAWIGQPVERVLTHPKLVAQKMEKRTISENQELIIFTSTETYVSDKECRSEYSKHTKQYVTRCSGGNQQTSTCSLQFLVNGKYVQTLNTVGSCYLNDSDRPRA